MYFILVQTGTQVIKTYVSLSALYPSVSLHFFGAVPQILISLIFFADRITKTVQGSVWHFWKSPLPLQAYPTGLDVCEASGFGGDNQGDRIFLKNGHWRPTIKEQIGLV